MASARPPRSRDRVQGLGLDRPKHPRQNRIRPISVSALRIGVAGAGNIASIAQLPTLVARDDIELSALVIRKDDPQPLMRRWKIPQRLSDHRSDARRGGTRCVVRPHATSEHVHATRIVLQASVDVFCEKPLATSASQAQLLADLAAARTVVMVGVQPAVRAGYLAAARLTVAAARFCVALKNAPVSRTVRPSRSRATWSTCALVRRRERKDVQRTPRR